MSQAKNRELPLLVTAWILLAFAAVDSCLVNFTQGAVVFSVMRIYRTLGCSLERMPPEAL